MAAMGEGVEEVWVLSSKILAKLFSPRVASPRRLSVDLGGHSADCFGRRSISATMGGLLSVANRLGVEASRRWRRRVRVPNPKRFLSPSVLSLGVGFSSFFPLSSLGRVRVKNFFL